MGATDPQQAILEHLASPPGVWEAGSPNAGGVRSGVVHGGRLEQVDLATVRFVKHRQSGVRHAYLVAFDGTIPPLGPRVLTFHYVYAAEPDREGGWRVFGGAGGAGDAPRRGRPWVNLGGGGWPDHFYAGGLIEDAGAGIESIELRFANGVTLRDDAAEGVALFISEQPVATPATLVMLDSACVEIATQHPFPDS